MIQLQSVYKTYHRGNEAVEAIRGISLEIKKSEFVVILGPSGGGKSTLLNLIGGIDHPSSGTITIDGFSLEKASEEDLTSFRRDHVGFIFQFYNLLPSLNAIENVSLPLMAKGRSFRHASEKAALLLKRVGLNHRLNHLPSELSGGEQQRVAIARAIIAESQLLIADEPTGDLDSVAAQQVITLLHELNKQLGLTIIIATHNLSITDDADRVFELQDGQIQLKDNEKSK
jgi:ABC-type lipoprotein export system ATPase subunit